MGGDGRIELCFHCPLAAALTGFTAAGLVVMLMEFMVQDFCIVDFPSTTLYYEYYECN